MISISTLHSVPLLEPSGRNKNMTNRISTEALGGSAPASVKRVRGGWLITNKAPDASQLWAPGKVSDQIRNPVTLITDENVLCVEGPEAEILAAYSDSEPEAPKPAKRAKKTEAEGA